MAPEIFHPGTLAFIDSFNGLIPCKVVGVRPGYNGWAAVTFVTVRVTAARPGYRLGEEVVKWPYDVVPRSKVRVRSGQYRIQTDYKWEA